MRSANLGIHLGPARNTLGPAALAAAALAVASMFAAARASAGQPRPEQGREAVQASDFEVPSTQDHAGAECRWLPLREAVRLLRHEPREMVLFAQHRDGAVADEFRRNLAIHGYRVDIAMAADGAVPILELLRAVRGRAAVPPAVAVFPGTADVDSGTPLSQYSLALDEMILSLASRGARLQTIVLVTAPDAGEAGQHYRARLLQAARARGALVVDLAGTPSLQEAGDALAQAVRGAALHPSLLALPLYPLFAAALFWLWRRSRF